MHSSTCESLRKFLFLCLSRLSSIDIQRCKSDDVNRKRKKNSSKLYTSSRFHFELTFRLLLLHFFPFFHHFALACSPEVENHSNSHFYREIRTFFLIKGIVKFESNAEIKPRSKFHRPCSSLLPKAFIWDVEDVFALFEFLRERNEEINNKIIISMRALDFFSLEKKNNKTHLNKTIISIHILSTENFSCFPIPATNSSCFAKEALKFN